MLIFRTQPALDDLSSPFGSSPPAKAAHGLQKSKRAKESCSRDQMIIVRLPRGALDPGGGFVVVLRGASPGTVLQR